MASSDGAPTSWIPATLLVGAAYLVAGLGFAALARDAASNETRVGWRLAAWAVSAVAFAAHIWYESARRRSSPATSARHAALAVALGAFALAVAAALHGHATNHRFPLWALIVWPVLAALPAFVVALAAAALLTRIRPMSSRMTPLIVAALLLPLHMARAQVADSTHAGYSPAACPSCAEWNAPASPVRLIANSHVHYDHAGGIAAVQRASGARVAASPSSADALRRGTVGADDPQHAIALAYPAVTGTNVEVIADGDTIRVGPIALVAHFTPGHTPGGTSWSWRSCEGAACLDFVYADSQTPISDDGFLFTRSTAYPAALQDFARGAAVLEQLPCDVLLTPHPSASQMWERLDARARGQAQALQDGQACRRYAANARAQLARRIDAERAKK